MENFGDEYKHYWETNMFLQTEELDSWGLDEALYGYYDSSSPDGGTSSAPSKNIASERNRRKKLNDRLFALRAVVPNISKMDKISILKDATEYIQQLHEQEKSMKGEIMELESRKLKNPSSDFEQEMPFMVKSKKMKTENILDYVTSTSPIELIELNVAYMGDKTFMVSLTCIKRTDTIVKLCQVFESLRLKIITANITSFSTTILKTAFIQGDEEEKDVLQKKIHNAISAHNNPHLIAQGVYDEEK
ncbi:putative transcription factor bHLH family [Lupinus albus]|uniref:Putative transcription factor bHLH family n=1 Tax=Lupinus albus TaxID=3870 RepID=A0A6A4PJB9_LUPAL|nr:putative transcription factor bHLH family [Lupinus albus]